MRSTFDPLHSRNEEVKVVQALGALPGRSGRLHRVFVMGKNDAAQSDAGWAGCRMTLDGRRERWLVRLRSDLTAPDWFAESLGEDTFTYTL